jgi:hypothetical protein
MMIRTDFNLGDKVTAASGYEFEVQRMEIHVNDKGITIYYQDGQGAEYKPGEIKLSCRHIRSMSNGQYLTHTSFAYCPLCGEKL